MRSPLAASGIRSNLGSGRPLRFALRLFRRSRPGALPEAARPRKRVPCARAECPNTVLEEWEESGLLCSECALEEDLRDREARWDRMYPGR
jgi:hypothetical protein